ncbi:urease accessory protein UreF [Pseudomonas sp. Teo4]|uniref:urease accessory protein UreF n=1 Tax=Pseudomonas sp. Teo4 TaxID=3064528 RepID=UPI002ABABAD0|nr:urease accessory UreF family protein [Pseudomonas sp. Teo4]MDZ3991584.1 Urease accessory protein UreF [Pseudomonas sp. Teo4]
MNSDLALLRLLQLASPGLPVGGFTYSQGLEWAVEAGWVRDIASFSAWQREQLHDTLGYLDWPVLARLYRASQARDAEAFGHWSRFLLANRETAELRLEEQQRRGADTHARRLATGPGPGLACQPGTQPAGRHGLAWRPLVDPAAPVGLGHGFAWLEGAVMAGVKLVPFGQQAAQTLLRDLGEELSSVLDHALALDDDQLGGGLPLLAIASSRHETQYTRLFRS